MEKIIRESAFDKQIKNPGLKFNPGLALTGVRTTGPYMTIQFQNRRQKVILVRMMLFSSNIFFSLYSVLRPQPKQPLGRNIGVLS